MASALAEIYSASSMMPLDKVISILERETDAEKLSDFAKRVEAVKKIDSDNGERKEYWAKLAVWSFRRLGEVLATGQESGQIASKGQPKKEKGHDAPLLLKDLGIDRTTSKRAQQLAAIPEDAVTTYMESQTESGKEITKSGLLKSAKPVTTKRKPKKAAASKTEPAPKVVEEPEGGWEPGEATKFLKAADKAIGQALRAVADASKILGKPAGLVACDKHLDEACNDLARFKVQHKRKSA